MQTAKIKEFNNIIYDRFQFQKHYPERKSLLFSDIREVLKCNWNVAQDMASTHCNMVSFYAPIKAQGYTDYSYQDYFTALLSKNYVNDKGRFLKDKDVIADFLGFNFSMNYIYDLDRLYNVKDLDDSKFYQIKIKADTSGDHFMTGYIKDKVFYVSDTSYRGYDWKIEKYITAKNFKWAMPI